MKKLFTAAILLVGLSTATLAHASETKSGSKKETVRTERKKSHFDKKNDLNLTEDQRNKMKELRQSYKADSDKLRASHNESVKAILTPEQREKWDNNQKRRGEMRKHHAHNKGMQKSHHMRGHRDMKFDEATTEKLKALISNLKNDRKAIRDSELSRDEKNTKIRELNKQYRQQRSDIVKQARTTKAAQQ